MTIRATMIALGLALTTTLAFAASASPEVPDDDARGCCSHHKGVCGCQEHSIVCCDTSLSPTCTC